MPLKNRNRPKVNEEQLQLEKMSLSGCGKTSLLSQKRRLYAEEEAGVLPEQLKSHDSHLKYSLRV